MERETAKVLNAAEAMASLGPVERAAFELALVRRCPQYDTCSAPQCPLDPLYPTRSHFPDEADCKALKRTRLEIVEKGVAEGVETAQYLTYVGLTVQEDRSRRKADAAKARFEALPEAEKQRIRDRLTKTHFRPR